MEHRVQVFDSVAIAKSTRNKAVEVCWHTLEHCSFVVAMCWYTLDRCGFVVEVCFHTLERCSFEVDETVEVPAGKRAVVAVAVAVDTCLQGQELVAVLPDAASLHNILRLPSLS